ncbi:hypothetical protein C8R44DRAFT_854455 [Mycena epipterygia]|nr:hypothetical protein C8R44DRAFT_854455 [Mycena epipterygia]
MHTTGPPTKISLKRLPHPTGPVCGRQLERLHLDGMDGNFYGPRLDETATHLRDRNTRQDGDGGPPDQLKTIHASAAGLLHSLPPGIAFQGTKYIRGLYITLVKDLDATARFTRNEWNWMKSHSGNSTKKEIHILRWGGQSNLKKKDARRIVRIVRVGRAGEAGRLQWDGRRRAMAVGLGREAGRGARAEKGCCRVRRVSCEVGRWREWVQWVALVKMVNRTPETAVCHWQLGVRLWWKEN